MDKYEKLNNVEELDKTLIDGLIEDIVIYNDVNIKLF